MNILAELRSRFRKALTTLDPSAAEFAEMVLPSQDAKFGDYQANCAMPLGKRLGNPPREIAKRLVELLNLGDLCDPPEIAGPGFINLRLNNDFLVSQLQAMVANDSLGVAPVSEPKTIVLDYSAPNVAKPMHVGHIRSTVIGAALYRVLTALGHRVISDNHIGDWGTQFGMIIYGYKHLVDEPAFAKEPVAELSRLYRMVNQLVEYHDIKENKLPAVEKRIIDAAHQVEHLHDATELEDPKARKAHNRQLQQAENQLAQTREMLDDLRRKLAAVDDDAHLSALAAEHVDIGTAVLAETAALHAGDAENRSLWEQFLPACLASMDAIYQRLNVTFDNTLGESFYHDRLAGVVDDLDQRGLATDSEGARCVFIEGIDAPFIVQKQDGAFLYATTDLATIQYRVNEWTPDAIVYVVDHRQSLHFEQLFATARLWGYDQIGLEHVSFGTVLGEDGKPYKTRSGTAVGLEGLLDEAIERALAIVSANDDARDEPLLSSEERKQVGERVGIGAIKYADLAHNRTSDYVFSYDKMLAMQGNTAAYMQYSYARVRSIFAKGNVDLDQLRQHASQLQINEPAERALGLALLQLSEALERVAGDYRPNHLTAYLFDVASKYSAFFENCPVLKAENDNLRTSRLLLCDLTARTIAYGLELLGIQVVERM
ncbi:arginine--tRNA ligase [Bythopirellula polymerisocia]|uniref:Arginine--tRNA ligase n=1 Tax=Bythopirellula polymerisocia TaxID=2528003 RepID=A0A5C6CXW3_9BACT|nr:arginine--tRNA ligase [Bythopirellula polymerisocia]TWU29390.1 Arginine--tRNA ligase [Bythopirellula polymerisocia]